MYFSTAPSPPPPFSLATPVPPRTSSPLSSPLSRTSSRTSSPSSPSSRNASNHSRRLALPYAPPTPTSLSALLSSSPTFPPAAAHSWWTVLESRPTPNAPHLVIPVVRDHAALVQLVDAWPSEAHSECPKAMAAWIVDHLSSSTGHGGGDEPSTIANVQVVHQGAEVRIDLHDPRPLLYALCDALDLPASCHDASSPASKVLIDPHAAQEARGQAIAHFLTRLTSSSSPDRIPPPPPTCTAPIPPALAHSHRILRTPSGSRIIDLGAELGVATLLTSAGSWTPVTTLADVLLTNAGQLEFIVTTMANERCVKQAVALVEVVLGCEGPKIVAYAPAGAAGVWGLLACNRSTPIVAGGAASCKNDKVWAKVMAVAADAQDLPVGSSSSIADASVMDTQCMQLALTLLQYPSVLRRCMVSAESAPLATYAMRVAGLVGKQRKGAMAGTEVERVAAKVVAHAVRVLGGSNRAS